MNRQAATPPLPILVDSLLCPQPRGDEKLPLAPKLTYFSCHHPKSTQEGIWSLRPGEKDPKFFAKYPTVSIKTEKKSLYTKDCNLTDGGRGQFP